MKKSDDPRHLKRVAIMQALFSDSFLSQNHDLNKSEIKKISRKSTDIEELIEEAAPQFPVQKIARLDVAILKLAVFELVYGKKEPPKVIIDEAIELAKEFGSETSPGFINGVLGTIYNKYYGKSRHKVK
ncbi:transcription antitermination factor NusB [Candidatus Gottesmanbacteria bacterium RIFCSPHIGHO2_01_FULL_40_15]|uniref:Transcription antitermination factor NusB n=1 Tax=Candidatus Gottesmanbacteria bacterium RIFCSPHIGHO2_01_FULL_40_15 TaxID=1798376 RepID=A0A1F5Z394_9BACT|nr:MAG: transcription antitermination factor NusB [Candidatus Gottesmanbacteria bacterium RIFCSPHIGHO2_01_FULL_40_15]